MDLDEKRVGVAVRNELDEMKDVSARLAFLPELVARAAVEVDLARPQRRVERLAVHVREHEHRACGGVLHDRGDQPALVEADLLRHAASTLGRTLTPRRASSSFSAETAISPEWKIDAASPASARVRRNSSTKCATSPPPPDALTGTPTASATPAARSRPN